MLLSLNLMKLKASAMLLMWPPVPPRIPGVKHCNAWEPRIEITRGDEILSSCACFNSFVDRNYATHVLCPSSLN
nr:hypothetical protein CFP56_21410 [Quercus suber]